MALVFLASLLSIGSADMADDYNILAKHYPDPRSATYYGEAARRMRIMKDEMRHQDLQQLSRTFTLPDGTVIFCQSMFGVDKIKVMPGPMAPPPMPRPEAPEFTPPEPWTDEPPVITVPEPKEHLIVIFYAGSYVEFKGFGEFNEFLSGNFKIEIKDSTELFTSIPAPYHRYKSIIVNENYRYYIWTSSPFNQDTYSKGTSFPDAELGDIRTHYMGGDGDWFNFFFDDSMEVMYEPYPWFNWSQDNLFLLGVSNVYGFKMNAKTGKMEEISKTSHEPHDPPLNGYEVIMPNGTVEIIKFAEAGGGGGGGGGVVVGGGGGGLTVIRKETRTGDPPIVGTPGNSSSQYTTTSELTYMLGASVYATYSSSTSVEERYGYSYKYIAIPAPETESGGPGTGTFIWSWITEIAIETIHQKWSSEQSISYADGRQGESSSGSYLFDWYYSKTVGPYMFSVGPPVEVKRHTRLTTGSFATLRVKLPDPPPVAEGEDSSIEAKVPVQYARYSEGTNGWWEIDKSTTKDNVTTTTYTIYTPHGSFVGTSGTLVNVLDVEGHRIEHLSYGGVETEGQVVKKKIYVDGVNKASRIAELLGIAETDIISIIAT